MSDPPKTAYITGGASGIGLALSAHLLSKNYKVFIADRNTTSAAHLADEHNTPTNTVVYYGTCDTSNWESQLAVFQTALKDLGGRITCVFPTAGIGEKKWLPFPYESSKEPADSFTKPDLSVIDIDLTGVLYTAALAVQHFRRQDRVVWGHGGVRGAVSPARHNWSRSKRVRILLRAQSTHLYSSETRFDRVDVIVRRVALGRGHCC